MEPQELAEVSEKARGRMERAIGLTMAIIAAFLASVTLVGHRLHTEEIVLQTKATDQWSYYQAKNSRYHMYTVDATLAELMGPQGAAASKDWKQKAADEHTQAEQIRQDNEKLDEETQATARRALYFDGAEITFEVAIVLCSVALLTGNLLFWRVSFVGGAIGLVIAALGLLRH